MGAEPIGVEPVLELFDDLVLALGAIVVEVKESELRPGQLVTR